jgi:hypothetical protein
MKSKRDLLRATVPPESDADFLAERQQGLARIRPLNLLARAWLENHVMPDAIWDEGSLILEVRFFAELADAIIDAGFTFERDPLPN